MFKKAIDSTLCLIAAGVLFTTVWGAINNYLLNGDGFIRISKGEVEMTRLYSPLSYLNLELKDGIPTAISQKSSLTDSTILRFELNSQGKVERMIDDSALYGFQKLRSSYPKENPEINWDRVNQTAQGYIAYFGR